MIKNLIPSPDGQTNFALAVLRKRKASGPLKNEIKLVPGVTFLADPALALQGAYSSPEGRILELAVTDANPAGTWCTLSLDVPLRDLGDVENIGFVARILAPQLHLSSVCLRSEHEDGFVDCFFEKQMLFSDTESTHLDVLSPQLRAEVPKYSKWRQLVFFLPTEAMQLSINDLRVFVL